MKDAIKKTAVTILVFLISLSSIPPIMAETDLPGPNDPNLLTASAGTGTGCTEQTSLRRGWYCSIKNIAGVVMKKWWACDATYRCAEGTRHKFYCVQQEPAYSYNNYYFNTGIVNDERDRTTVISKCIESAGNLMEVTCRNAYLNWEQHQ